MKKLPQDFPQANLRPIGLRFAFGKSFGAFSQSFLTGIPAWACVLPHILSSCITVCTTSQRVTPNFVTEISGCMEIQICRCLEILVFHHGDHYLPPWRSDFAAFILKVEWQQSLISMVAVCDITAGKIESLSSGKLGSPCILRFL